MTIRVLRLLTVAAALLALALPAAGVAAPGDKPVDRGVVQSVSQAQIVLRALDGSIVSFSVSPDTRVRLNGARASLGDDRARVRGQRLPRPEGASRSDRGVRHPGDGHRPWRGHRTHAGRDHAAHSRRRRSDASTLDRNTRFRFQGLPARRFVARPGALVTVTHATDAPALVVNVLKRAGA